ncbi:hypothetical protein SCHIN_v1c06090 [Spiroplasma chinense]|uniref:Uncharacterized protein n=1 Tax=Spiroplasma chinense TaxID=216932 RepID=A0A5B9Y528_9MOLU|nr:SEC-C domain-containing protein [Spiroplasma chinense]QEH61806.1 hypothetical protein SCHIN_v1c06090 [Spiroplasma chinense]
MDKLNENNETLDILDRSELYKANRNNKISDTDAQKFVDKIFENYFLDNDNINFLQMNGFNFFVFNDNELCFCLSAKKYSECCKANLKKEVNENYIPYESSLTNKKTYLSYMEYSNALFEKHYKVLSKLEACNWPECKSSSVENKLYNIDFSKKNFLTTNTINPMDNNYKMGEVFFKPATNKNFKFFGLCKEHNEMIDSIVISKTSSDDELLKLHFKPILYKAFLLKVQLEMLKEEFRNNFNSIKEEGFKSLFIYRLRKVSNQTSSLLNLLNDYKKNVLKNESYEIIRMLLPSSETIKVYDLIYPQICPDDFRLVNSVNNVFVQENAATLIVVNDKSNSYISFVYDTKNKALNEFFKQYLKIIKNKAKSEAAFVSNCSLLFADNVLFNEDFFKKITDEDKALFSALNKFRYENPNMGQEYLKMKFFAGFNKGNNFF